MKYLLGDITCLLEQNIEPKSFTLKTIDITNLTKDIYPKLIVNSNI